MAEESNIDKRELERLLRKFLERPLLHNYEGRWILSPLDVKIQLWFIGFYDSPPAFRNFDSNKLYFMKVKLEELNAVIVCKIDLFAEKMKSKDLWSDMLRYYLLDKLILVMKILKERGIPTGGIIDMDILIDEQEGILWEMKDGMRCPIDSEIEDDE